VIEKKTGDILANIDEVKDAVIKHLNDVAYKMKEKVTSSKKNTVITLSDEVTELLETYWFQRSLTDLSVAKSLLSSPYLDQSSFGLFCLFQPSIPEV
jgi:hypothetical protein